MPPVIVAAGIAATAAVGSAVISSSASKKAVNAQTAANNANNALLQQNRAENQQQLQPFIDRGNTAGGYVADLLGIGGDPARAHGAFDTFRGSTGYQFQLDQGLKAVNANAYARGMGDSGATLKALQNRGQAIADTSMQGYLGNLMSQRDSGVSAANALAGVGTATTQAMVAGNQNVADARSNAALANGANLSSAIQNVLNAGAYAYGSSYKTPVAANGNAPTGMGGYAGPMIKTPYGYLPGGFGGRA